MNQKNCRAISMAVIAAMLSACAVPPQGGAGQASGAGANSVEDPCSVGQSAAAGAAVGALLGALVDGKRGAVRGAALGGVAAAAGCYAVNVRSRQTKTALQANNDYVRARGSLPREPVVVAYSPSLNGQVVTRGRPFTVNSTVELVDGSTQRVDEVREEIVVFDPAGQEIKSGSKQMASTNRGGGRFENSFELTLPKGVSQGTYGVKTNLYVNGRLASSRDMRAQLVWDGSEGRFVADDARLAMR